MANTERRMLQLPSNLNKEGEPECPSCGCNKSNEISRQDLSDDKVRVKLECDHCMETFHIIQTE